VEKQGGIRPGEVSKENSITRLAGRSSKTTEDNLSRRSGPRRKRFEGKHPSFSWSHQLETPRIGYAPSKNRIKQWSTETRIEGWFSQSEEHHRFDTAGKLWSGDTLIQSDPLPLIDDPMRRGSRLCCNGWNGLRVRRSMPGASSVRGRCVLTSNPIEGKSLSSVNRPEEKEGGYSCWRVNS